VGLSTNCKGSLVCAYEDATKQNLVCSNNQFDNIRSSLEDGSACTDNNQCSSNICRKGRIRTGEGNTDDLIGECGKGEILDQCYFDEDCKTDYCGVGLKLNGELGEEDVNPFQCCAFGFYKGPIFKGTLATDYCSPEKKIRAPGLTCSSNGDDNYFGIDETDNRGYLFTCEHGCGQVGIQSKDERGQYQCCTSKGSTSGFYGEWCKGMTEKGKDCGYDSACKSNECGGFGIGQCE